MAAWRYEICLLDTRKEISYLRAAMHACNILYNILEAYHKNHMYFHIKRGLYNM